MRIACPSCAAAYEVPDQLVIPGRRTRCARCGHQWVAVPVESDLPPPVPLDPNPPEEPETAGDEVPPPPRRSAVPKAPPPAPPRSGPWLRLAWAASLLMLVGLGVAGVLGRHAVMTAWPPSARLYAALGLAGEGSDPAAPRAGAPGEGAPSPGPPGGGPAPHGAPAAAHAPAAAPAQHDQAPAAGH